MAGAKELRSKLNEEFLTCQICLNLYADPVSLDCQHSFCRDCVGQCMPQTTSTLHCPVCRQKTVLPKKFGILSLRKNFFLQSLIDTLNTRRPSEISLLSADGCEEKNGLNHVKETKFPTPLCDNCESESHAVARCLDCTDHLCRDCEAVHCQTKFTKLHKVVRLRDLRSGNYSSEIQSRAKAFCGKHPSEVCRQICVDCFVSACHECLSTRHQDHSMKDIKDAVSEQKERALRLLESANGKEDDFVARAAELAKTRERLRQEKKTALDEIQKRTKAIAAAAKAHEDKLLKCIKSLCSSRKQGLESAEEETQKKLAILQQTKSALKQRTDHVLRAGTPSDILSLKAISDDVEDSLTQLERIELATSRVESDWRLVPNVGARESSSFVLDRIKPILNKLIGHLECPDSGAVDPDYRDIVNIGDNNDGAFASSPSTYKTEEEVVTPPNQRENQNSNYFTTDDDEENNPADRPLYYKMSPDLQKRRPEKREKPGSPPDRPTPPVAESPSLNLMRKFPPRNRQQSSSAVAPPVTAVRKHGVSDVTEAAGTSVARHFSRSDAGCKNRIVVRWRNKRSKSADILDEPTSPQTPKPRTRPKSGGPESSLQTAPSGQCDPGAVRGRTRRRSLPSATATTIKDIATQDGGGNSLMHLATSPVAVLAENPARLGIYQSPDPTSHAAVASLSHTIASAPTLDDIHSDNSNGDAAPSGTEKTFAGLYPMGSDEHLFVKAFQSNGKPATFRSAPKLAVTAAGHVVASDYKAQRVYLFDGAGAVSASIKTKAPGMKCLHPISATSTKEGKLLVACGDAIYKFTRSGKMAKKLASGCFRKCCGIALNPISGQMVVSDIDKKCISVHAPDGCLERIFRGDIIAGSETRTQMLGSTPGAAEHRLQTPYFVAVDPRTGNIVVSDWANNDVKVFDMDGGCLACIFSCSKTLNNNSPFSPTPADEFSNPAGVAFDTEGNLFVADHGRHRVAMFDYNWQFQRFIATAKDGLQNPWSVASANNRQLYVSEYWSRTIKRFDY